MNSVLLIDCVVEGNLAWHDGCMSVSPHLGRDRMTKFEVSLDIQPGLYGEILLQNRNLFMYLKRFSSLRIHINTYKDKTL